MSRPTYSYYLIAQTLKGPDDTPYAGGTFEVDIVIPEDYPFSPPKMKFITKGLSVLLITNGGAESNEASLLNVK